MNVKSKFQNVKSVDDRARYVLSPVKVIKTWGCVENAENLLTDAASQVAFDHALTSKGVVDPAILKNDGGEHAAILLDFGREIHGTLKIYNDVPFVNVRIRLGESVSEAITPVHGEKNATNDHAVRDMDFPVSAMSYTETAESGFRFAYVELLDAEKEMRLMSVEAVLICYDMPEIGWFKSSDETLNKIYDTAAYTLSLCMQRYVWDGIKRDRLVWIGDMNPEIKTTLALYGKNKAIERSLDFIRDLTPPTDSMCGISSYCVWWVIRHYDYFYGTGDMKYLAEQKAYLMELLPRLASYAGENGEENLPGMKFIDWPNKANEKATHAALQGLLRLGLLRGAELMRILGERKLALVCAEAAGKLLKSIPDPNGSKQAASFLALSGIADPKEMAEQVMLPGGAKGYSTFLGYYTLAATAKAGYYDEALDTLRTYWGKMLELGATTFWEDFNMDWAENAYGIDSLPVEGKDDIHGDFGGYCYVKLRHSLCHGWSSGPVAYLTEEVLGVKFVYPGGKMITVDPHLSDLTFAEGEVPTAFGPIHVRHEVGEDGKIKTDLTLPEGVTLV